MYINPQVLPMGYRDHLVKDVIENWLHCNNFNRDGVQSTMRSWNPASRIQARSAFKLSSIQCGPVQDRWQLTVIHSQHHVKQHWMWSIMEWMTAWLHPLYIIGQLLDSKVWVPWDLYIDIYVCTYRYTISDISSNNTLMMEKRQSPCVEFVFPIDWHYFIALSENLPKPNQLNCNKNRETPGRGTSLAYKKIDIVGI